MGQDQVPLVSVQAITLGGSSGEQGLNLRHLRAFEAAARLGSLNLAAAETRMAQSAVTYAIKSVEQFFGCPLLVRNSRGCIPTSRGNAVAKRSRRFNLLLEEAVQSLHSVGDMSVAGKYLTLPQISAIIAVDRLVRPLAAADSLGITVSALLRRIREVEQSVGRPIFQREKGCFIVPDETLGFVGRLTLANHELQFAAVDSLTDDHPVRPIVSIGCVGLARTELMPKVIASYSDKHPDSTMQVHHESFSVLYRRLRFGEIDLLVCTERNDVDHEIVDAIFLYEDEYVVLCRSGHPLEDACDIQLPDLLTYDWIMPLASDRLRRSIATSAGVSVDVIRVTLETPSTTTSWALLLESDRLMLSSAGAVGSCLQEQNIHVLPIKLPVPTRRVMLYTRKTGDLPKEQSDFVRLILAAAQRRTAIRSRQSAIKHFERLAS